MPSEIPQINPITGVEWPSETKAPAIEATSSQKGWSSQDTLEQMAVSQKTGHLKEEEQDPSSSVWREISRKFPWWRDVPQSSAPVMPRQVESPHSDIEELSAVPQVKRIAYVPELEKPEAIQESRAIAGPSSLSPPSPVQQKLQSAIQSLFADSPLETKEQILARIALIKDNMTLIFALMNEQLALEQRQGEISAEIIHQIRETRKSLEGMLDKMKNDLERDRKIGSYFGYAQILVSIAALIGGIAMAVSNPLTLPTLPTLITTLSGIVVTSGKAFFQLRANQTDKKADDIQYQQDKHKKAMETTLEQYMTPALETAVEIRAAMFRMARTNDEVKRMIIRR